MRFVLGVLLVAATGLAQTTFRVEGTVTGCYPGFVGRSFGVRDTIYVIEVSKATELISVIAEMKLPVNGEQYGRLVLRLREQLKRTPHVAVTNVGPKGVFKIKIRTNAKELLIVAYEPPFEEEDDDAVSVTVKADQASLASIVLNETPEYPFPGPCPPAQRRTR